MFEIIETFKAFRKLSTDERGVTTLEYGLIAAAIGVAITAAAPQISGLFTSIFTTLAGKVT